MADRLLARRLHLLQGRLYGILDLGYVAAEPERLLEVGRAMIAGGVDIIQLRAKKIDPARVLVLVRELKPLFAKQEALFIINDHIEIAREVDADGVHIGQEDGPISAARRLLHPDQLVGKSTHSLEQAIEAEREDADYIGVGPIFTTPTKPDYVPVGLSLIRQVRERVDIPQFCIGGIKLENLRDVVNAGAERAVIVSGILQAPDITEYCLRLKSIVGVKGLLA